MTIEAYCVLNRNVASKIFPRIRFVNITALFPFKVNDFSSTYLQTAKSVLLVRYLAREELFSSMANKYQIIRLNKTCIAYCIQEGANIVSGEGSTALYNK